MPHLPPSQSVVVISHTPLQMARSAEIYIIAAALSFKSRRNDGLLHGLTRPPGPTGLTGVCKYYIGPIGNLSLLTATAAAAATRLHSLH